MMLSAVVAYELVQRNAMKVWEQGKDFQEELLAEGRCAGRREHLLHTEEREKGAVEEGAGEER